MGQGHMPCHQSVDKPRHGVDVRGGNLQSETQKRKRRSDRGVSGSHITLEADLN